jgi:hypothetical protein
VLLATPSESPAVMQKFAGVRPSTTSLLVFAQSFGQRSREERLTLTPSLYLFRVLPSLRRVELPAAKAHFVRRQTPPPLRMFRRPLLLMVAGPMAVKHGRAGEILPAGGALREVSSASWRRPLAGVAEIVDGFPATATSRPSESRSSALRAGAVHVATAGT